MELRQKNQFLTLLSISITTALLAANVISWILGAICIVVSVSLFKFDKVRFLADNFSYLYFLNLISGIGLSVIALLIFLQKIQIIEAYASMSIIGLQLWILRWLEKKSTTSSQE